MWIWSFAVELFGGDKLVAAVALAMLFLTVLSAAVGFCVRSVGVYAALCLLFVSLSSAFFLSRGVEERALAFVFAVEGSAVGIGYVTVYILLEMRKKILLRRTERAEIKRRLQFTLPDRENGYLRDRLHTALNTEKEEFICDKSSAGVRIGYAQKMLAKIKAAPLTPVERIDVEEMARLLALYESKGKWTVSDVKAMSEVFSRLLKLSAKYEIAV